MKQQLIIEDRLSESNLHPKNARRILKAVEELTEGAVLQSEQPRQQSPDYRLTVLGDKALMERFAKVMLETPPKVWKTIGGPPGLDIPTIAAKLVAKCTILNAEGELKIDPDALSQLCYGLVQLGKSAIRNAVLTLMSHWDLIDLAIVSTGRDDSARPMQIDRANNLLEGLEVFESSDGKDITRSNFSEAVEDVQLLLENGRKVVIFTKSNPDTLAGAKRLTEVLKSQMPSLRVLVIADEADEAHLPLKERGRGSSAELKRAQGIHRAFTDLAKYADCGVIWFTATPMPLLLSPKDWRLYPKYVTVALPDPSSAYYDCHRFLSDRGCVIDPWIIRDPELPMLDVNESIAQVPRWVLEHMIHHVVTEAIRWPVEGDKPDVDNGGSHISLVNPSLKQSSHAVTAQFFRFAKRRLVTVIGDKIGTGSWVGAEAQLVRDVLSSVTARLNKSETHLGGRARRHAETFGSPGSCLIGPPYTLERLIQSLISTDIRIMNQKQGGPWEERRANAILIAGQRIGRGVSAQGLVAFSMPWRPKLYNHDTQGQRLRFQGQRGPLINLFRIALLPETVDDMSNMTFSELDLRARLKKFDDFNVDLRGADIPYLTDPHHAPAGPARQGNAQHGEAAATSQSSTMRLRYVRYDASDESVVVDSSELERFAKLIRDLGSPDVVHQSGHLTWHNVLQRRVRDLLICTSDPRRFTCAVHVEGADRPLSVTLIAGLGKFSTLLPRQLSRVYGKPTKKVRRRATYDEKDADGNKTGGIILNIESERWPGQDWLSPTSVESSYSPDRWADLALDGFGDKNGHRKPGEPGHAVFYPTQLTRRRASRREAAAFDGSVALIAAVAMSEDTAEDAHRSEWLNVSEAPEEEE
jgi:hypothetical protein